jgi:hypothetical protein
MVRNGHTSKSHAVTGTETKLECIKQVCFFNILLDYLQNLYLAWAAQQKLFYNNIPNLHIGHCLGLS